MTNITMLAYDYLDELRKDKQYQQLLLLNNKINSGFCNEIKVFNKAKKKYEDVIQYGTYHPDFSEVTKEFSKRKMELYNLKEVKEYININNEIEKKVNSLLTTLAQSISTNIPVENELGLFSIGGSCSGCK